MCRWELCRCPYIYGPDDQYFIHYSLLLLHYFYWQTNIDSRIYNRIKIWLDIMPCSQFTFYHGDSLIVGKIIAILVDCFGGWTVWNKNCKCHRTGLYLIFGGSAVVSTLIATRANHVDCRHVWLNDIRHMTLAKEKNLHKDLKCKSVYNQSPHFTNVLKVSLWLIWNLQVVSLPFWAFFSWSII